MERNRDECYVLGTAMFVFLVLDRYSMPRRCWNTGNIYSRSRCLFAGKYYAQFKNSSINHVQHVSVEWLISKHYWIQCAFASIGIILSSKYYSCFLKNLCHSTFHFSVTRYPFANLSNKDAAIGQNLLACFFCFSFTFRWLSTCLTIKQLWRTTTAFLFFRISETTKSSLNLKTCQCFVITWTQTLKCFHRNIKYFCFFR